MLFCTYSMGQLMLSPLILESTFKTCVYSQDKSKLKPKRLRKYKNIIYYISHTMSII